MSAQVAANGVGFYWDARCYTRFPVEIPVRCEFGGHPRQFRAVNISRLGMLVTGTELPKAGMVVKLQFSLGRTEEMEIEAMVQHRVHGCGVQFLEVLPEYQMELIDYLDRLAT